MSCIITNIENSNVDFWNGRYSCGNSSEELVRQKSGFTRFHLWCLSFLWPGFHSDFILLTWKAPHCQAATQSKAALESISLVEVGIREKDDFGRGCYWSSFCPVQFNKVYWGVRFSGGHFLGVGRISMSNRSVFPGACNNANFSSTANAATRRCWFFTCLCLPLLAKMIQFDSYYWNGWFNHQHRPCSLLNDEEMSTWVGVEHLPVWHAIQSCLILFPNDFRV